MFQPWNFKTSDGKPRQIAKDKNSHDSSTYAGEAEVFRPPEIQEMVTGSLNTIWLLSIIVNDGLTVSQELYGSDTF